jgi:integrase
MKLEAHKLTKRTVDALLPGAGGKDVIYFDVELRGFGVRVKASGAKSYILKYRNKFGQQRKLTIARVGELTPEEARTEAVKLRGRVACLEDPALERSSARKSITVAELCDQYLEAGEGRLKQTTLLVDKSRIERHVKPLLGSRPVVSLTPLDMERFLRDVTLGKSKPKAAAEGANGKRTRGGLIRGGSAVGSRTLGMLGTILQRAVRDGVIEKNPVRGIPRPKQYPYRPPFSFEAVAAVGAAMAAMGPEGENPIGLRAIRILLTTGMRRMEALTLRWGNVDGRAHCLRFDDTKTGPQFRPIGRGALDFLASFKPDNAEPSDYVFPGGSKEGFFVGLPHVWARVGKRAQLSGVSLHGLRHWYASAAADMNYSELTIAGMLGHKVKGVTARYATAPDSALVTAADAVSRRLASALDGTVETQ